MTSYACGGAAGDGSGEDEGAARMLAAKLREAEQARRTASQRIFDMH